VNWTYLRAAPWLDTRARFVASLPRHGVLLDLGSSDGQTLRHMYELRPDLRLRAVDRDGQPTHYPAATDFQRADLEQDRLGWDDASVDGITCMHLVEHLTDPRYLLGEVARLLKPHGRVYFETPHPRSLVQPSPRGTMVGTFTSNFYDDPTHVRIVTTGVLAQHVRDVGLVVEGSGTSRNLIFAAAYPFLMLRKPTPQRYTARNHLIGWSAYLTAHKP